MDKSRKFCNRDACSSLTPNETTALITAEQLQQQQRQQRYRYPERGQLAPIMGAAGNSTQILFIEPNFVETPSEFETFYDCFSSDCELSNDTSGMSRAMTNLEDPDKFRGTLKKVVCTSHKLLKSFDEATKKQKIAKSGMITSSDYVSKNQNRNREGNGPIYNHNENPQGVQTIAFTIPVNVQIHYPDVMSGANPASDMMNASMEPIRTSIVAATTSPQQQDSEPETGTSHKRSSEVTISEKRYNFSQMNDEEANSSSWNPRAPRNPQSGGQHFYYGVMMAPPATVFPTTLDDYSTYLPPPKYSDVKCTCKDAPRPFRQEKKMPRAQQAKCEICRCRCMHATTLTEMLAIEPPPLPSPPSSPNASPKTMAQNPDKVCTCQSEAFSQPLIKYSEESTPRLQRSDRSTCTRSDAKEWKQNQQTLTTCSNDRRSRGYKCPLQCSEGFQTEPEKIERSTSTSLDETELEREAPSTHSDSKTVRVLDRPKDLQRERKPFKKFTCRIFDATALEQEMASLSPNEKAGRECTCYSLNPDRLLIECPVQRKPEDIYTAPMALERLEQLEYQSSKSPKSRTEGTSVPYETHEAKQPKRYLKDECTCDLTAQPKPIGKQSKPSESPDEVRLAKHSERHPRECRCGIAAQQKLTEMQSKPQENQDIFWTASVPDEAPHPQTTTDRQPEYKPETETQKPTSSTKVPTSQMQATENPKSEQKPNKCICGQRPHRTQSMPLTLSELKPKEDSQDYFSLSETGPCGCNCYCDEIIEDNSYSPQLARVPHICMCPQHSNDPQAVILEIKAPSSLYNTFQSIITKSANSQESSRVMRDAVSHSYYSVADSRQSDVDKCSDIFESAMQLIEPTTQPATAEEQSELCTCNESDVPKTDECMCGGPATGTSTPTCTCEKFEIPQAPPLPPLIECPCTAPEPECPCLAEDRDLEDKLEEIICQCTPPIAASPPQPPPKPKRARYRLAAPQHRELNLCTPCRYDPSPLIDENGRIFCPYSCGCCLCPWKPRATESFEDRLKHQKIKVCKCRERGNIFEKFPRKELGCSNDSFFDVCPCREKAEAKFLEVYGYEMWTADDKLSDHTKDKLVTLDQVNEIQPLRKSVTISAP